MSPFAWVLWSVVASAQTEVCPGPLTPSYWQESMDAVDGAISEFNGERANNLLDDILYELRCLKHPVDPRQLGRLARQLSLMSFYEQDVLETESWALLARETLGGAPWPPGIPIPDTYHSFVVALPPVEQVEVQGQGLAPPKKGAILMDGRVIFEPRAALGTSHLVQVADKKGVVLATHWQHGAAFDEQLLGEPTEIKEPRWYTAPAAPVPPAGPPVSEPPATPEPVITPEPAAAPEPVAIPEPTVPEPIAVADADPPEDLERMFQTRDATEGCPWKREPKSAIAKGGTVQINRHVYPVRTQVAQSEFRTLLRSCGEFRAARRFERWREARRGLSLEAGRFKRGMVKALLTEEPKRRSDKR